METTFQSSKDSLKVNKSVSNGKTQDNNKDTKKKKATDNKAKDMKDFLPKKK
jgi:hypothetical protein